MSELVLSEGVDRDAILRHLNLNPRDPGTQALLLVCERYSLDPVLKHMVLISGKPYVTRDGYLHIAHTSGQLDGIEILDEGEDDDGWWARCAVYRKDMARPFTYRGRYPRATAGHMAKYGPEMAIKTAEVMALRRAFDVGGIGAADEQWDAYAPVADPATPEQVDAIRAAIAGLDDTDREAVKAWWKSEGFASLNSGRLSIHEAVAVLDHLDALTVTEGEVVEDDEPEAADVSLNEPPADLPPLVNDDDPGRPFTEGPQ